MNTDTKGTINTILMAVIAISVVYGVFIKEDSTPTRRSSRTNPVVENQSRTGNRISNQLDLNTEKQQNPIKPTNQPVANPTKVEFKELAHDFGSIQQNTTNDHVFTFTNTGDKPLIIESALGSCGCTVPDYPKQPIQPGETGEIKVTYKPGKQKGKQSKTVTITANTQPKSTYLQINAVVNE